jgi:hypothetical protein
VAAALVDRETSPQIGQSEGILAVAAVGRADQHEQGLVFRDGKQRAVAKHPSGRGEVASEHPDFSYIRLCHGVGVGVKGIS